GSGTTIDLGDGTLEPGETLTLGSGAELVGSGTLSSNLVNGGTVSPGNSPGIITVDGDYTQESDGFLEIELGGDVAGTDYDQLQVTGAASLNGNLNVSLIDGFMPSNGDQFLILDAESLSGTFTTINLPTLSNGLEWQTEYTATGFSISAVGAGTITGTVTYDGRITDPHDIIVGIHGSVDDPPYESIHILSWETYTFENVPEDTYYISAFLDVNDSGNGPPDDGEPFSWYVDLNGDPKAVVISGGNTIEDVDITLEDSSFLIFLPLILK
ncbi:MAG TPA: autotransporter outer membrane beta-barrel domain-containing protein, partial [Anaerolineaceae bacterium]|nr:autotransporter outer membrane beta-barrel domain-containing protein [Anaerolineaceae bacterium]